MNKVKRYKKPIDRRKARIRAKVAGLPDKPRLSVFRSNKFIYAQAIDDSNSKTLVAGFSVKNKSFEFGEKFGKRLLKKGVKKAVFDRGGYKYHGVVKNLSEGIRKGGIQF
ncbi:MAG: 50S ribosomal protein L18 [Patescibacteria group bacterium]|nr:50S ribosomal protein L18 [Patescibacteria group bacterium]